ncbi:MAG TPA: hypothetical protein VGC89_08725 [Pyrinomonadaceae bacterium]
MPEKTEATTINAPSAANTQAPPPKPEPSGFLQPVAWLFGRQLIANLKYILLYTAFKGKLDPRDWMKANIIPPRRTPAEIDKFWRQWSVDRKPENNGGSESEQEFWFDYISDTGDGQRAVYSIAYMCMSDFTAKRNPQLGDDVEFAAQPDDASLLRDDKMLLPRGAFLFVGGDTSYHISDYATLANRFQNPFRWAYEDLKKGDAGSVSGRLPRLLFGIPGNHDYYDSLDGFNRQFRRPSTSDKVATGSRQPQLAIPTFRRTQEGSYLALRLPFDWWFWGLDTEEGEIDFRQWEFFNDIQTRYRPAKLIVATPEPTTVFGKYAKADESQSKTFAALELERRFLKDAAPLAAGTCRLDLSGDVHHYSRHWGPGSNSADENRYASVMSGGGGAFFHPSQTDIKELEPQVIYPQRDKSRAKVAEELFKLSNIVQGGWVWLFGFVIAFSIFFAATFPQSSKDVVDSFPPFVWAGISPPLEQRDAEPPTPYVQPMARYMWGPNIPPDPPTPPDFTLWMISLILAPAMLGLALYYSTRLFEKEYDPTFDPNRKKAVTLTQRVTLWAMVLLAFAFLAYGLFSFHAYDMDRPLTRFGRSLIIMAALIWSVLAVIQSVKSSEWLFEEAHHRNLTRWQYAPLWILIFMSVLGFGSSLWFFGKQESSLLIADLGFLFVLLAVGLGLVYFAYSTGGHLKKGLGKAGFLLLGISHSLLQLLVPFLIVRKAKLSWGLLAMLAATLLIVVIFKLIGRSLAKLENGWPLALAWVLFGAALLSIPLIPYFKQFSASTPDGRWLQLLLCVLAGVIGAIMSCVLFGWYLAVALAFNGHNNEAGGAARIEGFKQLIRFRLNRQGLTGYVIGIDEPGTQQSELRPKIIDVFHLSER